MPGIDFPVRVLPLLMGASMFVQQKITPMQMDPAQARMMLIMMPGHDDGGLVLVSVGLGALLDDE